MDGGGGFACIIHGGSELHEHARNLVLLHCTVLYENLYNTPIGIIAVVNHNHLKWPVEIAAAKS